MRCDHPGCNRNKQQDQPAEREGVTSLRRDQADSQQKRTRKNKGSFIDGGDLVELEQEDEWKATVQKQIELSPAHPKQDNTDDNK